MNPAQRLAKLLLTMNSASRTRDDAHALLDAALDIADGANDAEGEDGRLAQAAALTLSRAVAGWMVPVERTPAEWDDLADKDPTTWREEVINRMRLTYALLPQPAIETLMFGLIDLQRGKPPPFLESKQAKLALRVSRQYLEQAMLVWIEMETARERLAGEVQDEVIAATKRITGRGAIEKWLAKWRDRDGSDRVDEVLRAAAAHALGAEIKPPFPDELLLISFLVSGNGSPLARLADSWNAAKG